jgi:hypothetical protein
MLNVVMLSVVMLNVTMQNVMAPSHYVGFHDMYIKFCKNSLFVQPDGVSLKPQTREL